MAKHTPQSAGRQVLDAPAAPSGPPAPNYRVTLHARTPLRATTLEVCAATESEAWQKFCAHNGITDSACQREIVPIE